jgi:predicted nucleotidyltransferase
MLNRHFRDFIELLEKHEVRYLVIGGYAVGDHGFPRYTGDLDIFIGVSAENADRILDVLNDFGFSNLGLNTNDFLEQDIVVELGREPMKIQVLTGIDGIKFEECYEAREEFDIEGIDVAFIGLEALIKNKAASPRAKDRIDLEELKKIQGEQDGTGNVG